MQHVKTVFKLNQCYSATEDELCNRHTTHLSAIKHKFEALYKKSQPTFFVVAKGICEFNSSTQQNNRKQTELNSEHVRGISMTIQNGVIIAVAKTEPKENIYINYNKWEELADTLYDESSHSTNESEKLQFDDELILNYKGEVQCNVNLSEQTHRLSRELAEVYQMAVQDVSLSKINGALLCISSNLPSDNFYHREALIYAFYVAFLKVNDLLEEYSVRDISAKLISLYRKKQSQSTSNNQIADGFARADKICKYAQIFSFSTPNTLLIASHSQQLKTTAHRFLFAKLHAKTLNKPNNESTLCSLLKEQQVLFSDVQGGNKQMSEVIGQMKKKYELFSESVSNNVSNILNKVIKQTEVSNFVSQGFCIVEDGQYLVFYVSSCYCADLVRKLAKLLKQQERNPQSSEEDEQSKGKDILEIQQRKHGRMLGKWGRNKVNELIFTSLPSIGFAILDVRQQLWFNE